MALLLAPTQSDIQAALGAFLGAVVPGLVAVAGQDNRVPEPSADNFVVVTAQNRPRLGTTVNNYIDCAFTASISGTVMTVTAVAIGRLAPGHPVFGPGVAAGTVIVSGPAAGGTGDYQISVAQNVGSERMAAGVVALLQSVNLGFLLDFHGQASPDNVQAVTTAWRDIYATDFFSDPARAGPAAAAKVSPLYHDEPAQRPFSNENMQIENRWAVTLHCQADQVLELPQQFADQLAVAIRAPVDAIIVT